MTVIIIEDDAAVCDAIRTFVTQLGHDAIAFEDAESFFAQDIPSGDDMVIVDIGLPGIDGVQVIRWLEALAEPPRILAITGQSQTVIRDFLSGSPTMDVLRKPLSASELAVYF
ncbi:MAG: response regulator [Pseudomonadota bacterium]